MSARSFWTNGAAQISKPGYDVFGASADQLILNISEKVTQLLLLAVIDSTQAISLGFVRNPIILVTGTSSLSSLPGYSGVDGPARPSPLNLGSSYAQSFVDIINNGQYMNVYVNSRTQISVYNRAL